MQEEVKKNFIQFYEQEADTIFRFIYFRISDREKALELTQDSFVKLWLALLRGEGVGNYRAFTFKVARNKIIDHYREKKSISLEGLADEDDEIDLFLSSEPNSVEHDADARFALSKINELDGSYRDVVHLRFVEGLMPKEIAQMLGEPVNTISVRLHRALGALAKILGVDSLNEEKLDNLNNEK